MTGYTPDKKAKEALIHLLGLEGAEEFVSDMNRVMTLEGQEFVNEFSRLYLILKDASKEVDERIAERKKEFKRQIKLMFKIGLLVGAGIILAAVIVKMAEVENQMNQVAEE